MDWSKLDFSLSLKRPRSVLTELWSTVDFESNERAEFARTHVEEETRSGVRTLATLFFLPMVATAIFSSSLGLDRVYTYGFLALAGLAVHIHLSSRAVREIEALYMLGLVLLVVSGTTFVLIAHRTGSISTMIFASVGLLFMAIPSMPWGLREGCLAAGLLYGLFTASTWSVAERFPVETLWTLQLYMAAAAMVSTTLVGRSALVRKRDLTLRFDLEEARGHLETLSLQDPLTGVWNRRYLDREFGFWACPDRRKSEAAFFALLDVDDFKALNDRFGHLYGDRVLGWVAEALGMATEQGGFVARVGGDEFVCLIAGRDGFERMEAAIAALEHSFRAAGEPDREPPTFSTGLVRLPDDRRCELEPVYKAADNALYETKRARSDRPRSSGITALDLRRSGTGDSA